MNAALLIISRRIVHEKIYLSDFDWIAAYFNHANWMRRSIEAIQVLKLVKQ